MHVKRFCGKPQCARDWNKRPPKMLERIPPKNPNTQTFDIVNMLVIGPFYSKKSTRSAPHHSLQVEWLLKSLSPTSTEPATRHHSPSGSTAQGRGTPSGPAALLSHLHTPRSMVTATRLSCSDNHCISDLDHFECISASPLSGWVARHILRYAALAAPASACSKCRKPRFDQGFARRTPGKAVINQRASVRGFSDDESLHAWSSICMSSASAANLSARATGISDHPKCCGANSAKEPKHTNV